MYTIWKSAIQAVNAALSNVDENFILMPEGTGNTFDPVCVLKEMEMIFTMGAHQTIIAEDFLPVAFWEHIKDPANSLYLLNDYLSLQFDAGIA